MKTKKEFENYLNNIKRTALEEGFDSLDETYVEHLRARYFEEDVIIGRTSRTILRELKMEDLEALYEFEDAVNEPVLQAFIKEDKKTSEIYLHAYIQNMYPMYDYGIWAVEEKESERLIGLCGLGQSEVKGEFCTDLGYYICPKWRNQGIAAECIQFVLDYVKNYL